MTITNSVTATISVTVSTVPVFVVVPVPLWQLNPHAALAGGSNGEQLALDRYGGAA
jgi:hypothetical protein